MTTQTAKKQLVAAVRQLRQAIEADYKCQGIDPRNLMKAHTWIAIAMRETDGLPL